MTAAAGVTVVIPVYGGAAEVRACIGSVLRHAPTTRTSFDVVVVDDASPDPAIAPLLDELADGAPVPVTVLRNPENLGFVASVNLGIARASGDIVVLNADTVVTAGWLDRLADAADRVDVATVTPLTNFGSICTLPASVVEAFDLDGDAPRIDECAAFVATSSPHVRPEVITGVGFCMYTTREALDSVGPFDVATFGRGYGEEVDFCLRASRLGFRHLVEDATFVHHHGGVSFGDEREARRQAGSRALHQRYRFFRESNRREQELAPLGVSFTAFELALTDRLPGRPHVLQVLHGPPDAVGGTEKHLHTLLTALLDEFDFSILFPVESGFVLRTMWNVGRDEPVVHEFLFPGAARWISWPYDPIGAEAMATVLDLFAFDVVHVQNLIGHSLAPLDVLADFPGPVVCSVRDLYLTCPHYWLLYRNEQPCGIPEDESFCARCLPETEGLTLDDLHDFRGRVGDHLDDVDRWVFASQSAADYLLRGYAIDPARIEVIEHGAIIDPGRRAAVDEALVLDEPLRIAFVGRGWAKKGLPIVNQLADELAGSSIEIHHFGELLDPASPELHTHGPYDNELLPDLLRLVGIQVVLLPGLYAETFGHVMTESLIAGVPVIGATYGALGERIRASGAGWTIDPTDPAALLDLVRNLDRSRDEVLRATQRAVACHFPTVADTAPRYAELYRAQQPINHPQPDHPQPDHPQPDHPQATEVPR